MKKVVYDTFKSTCFKVDPDRINNTFEILGFDFMMNDEFKLSLIEVNTNPCLETECPLLTRIVTELIENTFKIVLDPLFTIHDNTSARKNLINELPTEIKYQLIFDEYVDLPDGDPRNTPNNQYKTNCKYSGEMEIIESDKED